MSRFVRYTCNKKNEPTMRENCLTCPEYNPCAKDGEWCFVGALIAETEGGRCCTDIAMPLTESAVFPVMRDMSTVAINLGNGHSVDVLKEDFARRFRDEVCKTFGLPKGFLEK